MSQGVEIFREFLDAKGNAVSRVTVGQEFFVRLRVRATQRDRQPQIAVVDLLPGGVEPVLELQPPADSSTPGVDPARCDGSGARPRALPIGVPGKSDWLPSHIDVREDRARPLRRRHARTPGRSSIACGRPTPACSRCRRAFAEGMYNRTLVGARAGPASSRSSSRDAAGARVRRFVQSAALAASCSSLLRAAGRTRR